MRLDHYGRTINRETRATTTQIARQDDCGAPDGAYRAIVNACGEFERDGKSNVFSRACLNTGRCQEQPAETYDQGGLVPSAAILSDHLPVSVGRNGEGSFDGWCNHLQSCPPDLTEPVSYFVHYGVYHRLARVTTVFHSQGQSSLILSVMAPEEPPSQSSPPMLSAPTPLLPSEINAATQKQHTVLNRLIIARLGLALPPQTQDPTLLGHGLAAFAQIYQIFEDEWCKIEQQPQRPAAPDDHAAAVLSYLASLRPAGLHRTPRLQQDLAHLAKRTDTDLTHLGPRVDAHGELRAQLRQNPHLLLAYAWVMYMAIFSGGRWIRQQLGAAGPEFWTGRRAADEKQPQQQDPTALPGFSFLSFDSAHDGEDLKALFKARLAQADTLLTAAERRDVVDGAQRLFERCIGLVGELDGLVARRQLLAKLPRVATVVVAMLLMAVVLALRMGLLAIS
nr:heme-binding protein hmx1 [Quercus suber]